MNKMPKIDVIAWVVPIVIFSMPIIAILFFYNQQIHFGAMDKWLRDVELQNGEITKAMLSSTTLLGLAFNLIVVAIVPGIVEELFFRGVLQNIIHESSKNKHIAIWFTALFFSAVHMEFLGFFPRLLMGAMLGYMYVWTGNIWINIFAHALNNGISVVAFYLYHNQFIKTDIDNDKIKYQLNAAELKSPDLTKFDYLVLYPIDLSKKNSVGQLGVLFKSVDQDGNEVIKIKKQPTWSWTPAEVEEGLELQEQVINKGIADNPNVGVNTPSGINKGTSGSNKGSDVRTNIGKDLSTNGSSNNGTNNSGNTSLDKKITETPKTKEELRMFFGFVDDEGVTYDPKQRIIKMSQNPSQGEFGKGDLQNAIDNFSARSFYFDEYNDLMGMEGLEDKYKLKLPQGSPNAGKVITKDNVSELAPFRGDASKQFKQLTFGDFLNTTSPKATIDVESGKGSSDKSVGCSCKLRPDEVFDKLTNYIIAGLTGDESQSPDREGAGKEFCGCFKTGAFDQYIGRRGLKIDVTDLTGVSKTRLPKSLLNGKLDWDEIVMLMRGGKVSDVSMATTFHIPTFGDPNCRCLNTNTLRESIKGHISKAINSKKEVLKEERVIKSILSKIRQQGK